MQNAIDQSGFSMVNVGDDSDVSDFHTYLQSLQR
jgi:hypothetical protein